jgi:hypothetical protein
MQEQYQETEASRNARAYIRSHRIVPLAAEMVFRPDIPYDERRRRLVTRKDGSLNTDRALDLLGDVDVLHALVLDCMRMNYSAAEVHEIIKARYRRQYHPENCQNQEGYCGGLHLTMHGYPEWCKVFGITPDSNFPDWGDKQKAKLTIAQEIEFIEAGIEERVALLESGILN